MFIFSEAFIYYASSKCDFIFWFNKNKHCTKTYILIPWESIGIYWKLID